MTKVVNLSAVLLIALLVGSVLDLSQATENVDDQLHEQHSFFWSRKEIPLDGGGVLLRLSELGLCDKDFHCLVDDEDGWAFMATNNLNVDLIVYPETSIQEVVDAIDLQYRRGSCPTIQIVVSQTFQPSAQAGLTSFAPSA